MVIAWAAVMRPMFLMTKSKIITSYKRLFI